MSLDPTTPREFEAPDGALADRVILITGASDGIGRALAIECANKGALVIAQGRRRKKLQALADEIEAAGGIEPILVPMDFLKAEGGVYLSLAEQIEQDFGRLDGLVHCAGMLGEMTEIEDYDAAVWQQVMHVNVTSGFALTKVLLPLLKQSQGAIVFTSSSVGRKGRAFWGAYSVSKFAVEGLAQTLADELGKADVSVNVVNPGATHTNMRAQAYPAEDKNAIATPEAVLPSFMYFLCEADRSITGYSVNAQ
ncbi:MAG: YciK family oxidoreductase [Pseudomonadota bacterium]